MLPKDGDVVPVCFGSHFALIAALGPVADVCGQREHNDRVIIVSSNLGIDPDASKKSDTVHA